MKTAVHELIDDLLSGKIIETLAKSDYYLEKEKQHLVDFYHEGCSDWDNDLSDGETHYNETFKND